MGKFTYYAIVLVILFSFSSLKSQWIEDFDDGNFSKNPEWIGDTSNFFVNDTGWLQLNAPTTLTQSQLLVESRFLDSAEWKFKVKMDFNPSSGNYSKVYLMTDSADLNGTITGYYLRIGYTNDDICLFSQTGSSVNMLIDGRDKMLNSSYVNTNIRVKRDFSGYLQLFCDTTGNEDYQLLGSVIDNSVVSCRFFGIQCFFTSTRANKFFFDDFCVSGSVIHDTTSYREPSLYDIVFNEIMADPSPPGLLPEAEYFELFNRSKTDFNLKDWELKIGTTSYKLPDTLFKSGEYMVFTAKKSTGLFKNWCNSIGVFSSSTVLPNAGQYLELRDKNGILVTWLEYADTWYSDEFKKEGGWSIEQIDPENPCGGRNNWKASVNKSGGTPGSKNSIFQANPDLQPPTIRRVQTVNDSTVRLLFTESLDEKSVNETNFMLGIQSESPVKSSFYGTGFKTIDLQLNSKLVPFENKVLKLSTTITDCALNPVLQGTEIKISLPLVVDSFDIIINEVLFNSKPYCPDYIELFNRSSKYINMADLLIVINSENSDKGYRLANEDYLFYPGSYILLSSDPEELSGFYILKDENALIEIPGMISLNDDFGKIVIKTLDERVSDIFSYKKEMHLPTLINTEGISLERVSPDKMTYMQDNWHSCAETAGYGTPGYQNSQYLPELKQDETFFIENELFSPDNDAYNDILTIGYELKESGARVSAWVFDLAGRKVRELMNNSTISSKGSIYWDGVSDKGTLSGTGMYLVFVRVVYANGSSKDNKLPCVLAKKQ